MGQTMGAQLAMIKGVQLDRLRVPLTEPYRLSKTTVESFDVTLVQIETDEGSRGVGEVTCLKGYSTENSDKAWENVRTVGQRLPGTTVSEAMETVASELEAYPFSATGLAAGLETASDDEWPAVTAPVVGILSADDPTKERQRSLNTQVGEGFETIKVKIGFNPVADAAVLQELADNAPTDVTFRVDANQGYSLTEAQTFLSELSTNRVEHLEQPLPVGNLDDHATLTADSEIDIILDEEVSTAEDLQRVDQAAAADGVKFKLMKCGSLDTAVELLENAADRGFRVIFGNGVQSEVGCLLEAAVWTEAGVSTVGEFNGWQKQSTATLSSGIKLRDGCLHWDGSTPTFDEQTLSQYRIDTARFEQT